MTEIVSQASLSAPIRHCCNLNNKHFFKCVGRCSPLISTLSLFLSTSEEPRKTNIMPQQSAKAIKLVFSFNAPKYELNTSFLIERNNDVFVFKAENKLFRVAFKAHVDFNIKGAFLIGRKNWASGPAKHFAWTIVFAFKVTTSGTATAFATTTSSWWCSTWTKWGGRPGTRTDVEGSLLEPHVKKF